MARSHLAPATGIEMTLDNLVLEALKQVAGVEYRHPRTPYDPCDRDVRKSAICMLWPEVIEHAVLQSPARRPDHKPVA